MTNYNERLDELLTRAFNKHHRMLCGPVDGDLLTGEKDPRDTVQDEAKQALTSLIKELVTEAKPSKKHVGDEVAENRSYTGERLFNATIDEYHTNLLKALEDK